MRSRFVMLLIVIVSCVGGCSTSPPPPRILVIHSPPPPRPPLPDDAIVGRFCQLGTSCLDLDPRPFEMCLLGTTRRCGDKVREPLLVESPSVAPR